MQRVPHTRENFKAKQPVRYAWRGQLFGVQKLKTRGKLIIADYCVARATDATSTSV